MNRVRPDWRRAFTGWRLPALCLLLLAGTYLVYRTGLGGGWLYDDIPNIVMNPALRFAHLSWDNLWDAAFSLKAGPTWRPLSMATFAVEYHVFGPDASAFKLTNLLIHFANGLLVLALLTQILGALRETGRPILEPVAGRAFAFGVTTLWLLAPIGMSTVLYAVQREVLLATLFTLAGLLAYLRLRLSLWRHATPPLLTALVGVTLVAGFLATISKETGVLLPLYALVLELGIFRFRSASRRTSRSAWLYFGVVLFLPAALGLAWLLDHGVLAGYASRPFTLGQRLMTEPRILFHYLGWIVAPRLPALGFFHDDIALSTGVLSPVTTLPAMVGCAALLGGGLWLLPRRPLVAMGLLWFLAGQALESTFVPLILAFEHRNYLASLGPLLALAAFLTTEPALRRLRPAAVGAVVAFGLLCSWVAAGRSWEWGSDARLAVYQAAHHPGSARSAYMLGRKLTDAALGGAGNLKPQARRVLRHAASLRGSGLIPYTALILLAARTGQPVHRAWFRQMVERARAGPLRPSDISGLASLNRCLAEGPCGGMRDSLLTLYGELSKAAARHTGAAQRANLLVLHADAIGYATPAQRAAAKPLLTRAAALAPNTAAYRQNLVLLALREHDTAEARRQLRMLRKLNRHGSFDRAIRELRDRVDRQEHGPAVQSSAVR